MRDLLRRCQLQTRRLWIRLKARYLMARIRINEWRYRRLKRQQTVAESRDFQRSD